VRILAATATSEEAALELYDRIREAGFAARILSRATEGGGLTYELRLGGYANAAEAEAAAAVLQARTGLKPVVAP
jgi:cell division septation protein DedD